MKILVFIMLAMVSTSATQVLLPGERCYPLYGCFCVLTVDAAKKIDQLVIAAASAPDNAKKEFIECQRGYDCGYSSDKTEPACVPVPRKLLKPCNNDKNAIDGNSKYCACYKNENNQKIFCKNGEEACYEIDAYNNACIPIKKIILPGTSITDKSNPAQSKDIDSVCMAYSPTGNPQHIPHRPDRCSSPEDVCMSDREHYEKAPFKAGISLNKLNCGPKEGNVPGACNPPCDASETCWKNIFGAKCYKKIEFTNKFDPDVMQRGLSSQCKIRGSSAQCKTAVTCGLTFDGYLVCNNNDFNYPIIHDNEICLDKKEGCYCTHETNHLIEPQLCGIGAMCNTYETSVECTTYPILEYVECFFPDECGCGSITSIFSSTKDKGYCKKTKKNQAGERIAADSIQDPDLIMDQRIFKETYWAKLRAGQAIKISNKGAKEIVEIRIP